MILTFYRKRPRLSETPTLQIFFASSLLKAPRTIYSQSALPTDPTGSLFLFGPAWGANLLLDDAFGVETGSSAEADLQDCNRPGYAEAVRRMNQRRIPSSPIKVR